MVGTSEVNVQINNKSECVYKNTLVNQRNDLQSLITNLKSMQQNVNEILTKLVQTEQSSIQVNIADDDESEGNDNSDDEDGSSQPKKCKYK